MRASRETRWIGVCALVLGLLVLPACGGGGGGGDDIVDPPADPTGQVAFGPLADATLEIFEVRADGTFPLVHTQMTSTGATVAENGWFDPVPVALDPTTLYLFKASGGTDVDRNDDGVMDGGPKIMRGSVHALVLGAQAATGDLKLNTLTEIQFHRIFYMLVARYPRADVLAALDDVTRLLLGSDVDGSGAIDAADALRWDPTTDKSALRKSWDLYDELQDAMHDGDGGWVSWECESLADSSVAFLELGEAVQDVHVVGTRAYVALRDTGFAVVDISDPLNPTLLSEVDTLGEGEDLGVQGDFVYFARRDDDLMQIYDVSDPANPVARGSLPINEPDCMCLDGTLLFAIERDNERIHICDVSDPDAPIEITSIGTLADPNQVVKVSDYLYVADEHYLVVIDVSDPAAPFIRADIEAIDGDIDGLAVRDGYAYCADGNAGLVVVDVSNLNDLQIVANVPSRNECDRIWLEGNRLYMSAREAGVHVIDITTPTAPVHIGYCAVASRALVTCTAGGYAYVACDGAGLRVLDPSEPTTALYADTVDDLVLATLDTGDENTDVVASGDYAYVAIENGLTIVDISDPTSPSIVWTTDAWPDDSMALALQGDLLYVACEAGGLRIVDVSNPLSPVLKPPLPLTDEAQDVAVQGNYAYVADRYNAQFVVVDVSDPDASAYVGDVWTLVGDSIRGVAVQGSWGFGAWGETGLVSVDVTDPTDPVIEDEIEVHDVGSTDPDFAHKVVVDGDYAYVVAEELHIIDISDPTDLTFVRTVEISVDNNFAVGGGFGLMVEGAEGIRVMDLSDPTDPWTFTKLPSYGDAQSAFVHGRLLLVTNEEKGLTILRAPFSTDVP